MSVLQISNQDTGRLSNLSKVIQQVLAGGQSKDKKTCRKELDLVTATRILGRTHFHILFHVHTHKYHSYVYVFFF